MGEFLKAAPKNKGGEHTHKNKRTGSNREPVPTRAQAGLKNKKVNAEAQALADMKDESPELHEKVRCGGVGSGAGRGSRLAPPRRQVIVNHDDLTALSARLLSQARRG
jgi:hypothetical protein